MKLTHNSRNFSRKVFNEFGTLTRFIIIFGVLAIFFLSWFFESSNIFFKQNESVSGAKSAKTQDVDIKMNLVQAAQDAASGKINEAREKLKIVLEFEPDNIYANDMNSKITREFEGVEKEISRTLQIINLQPNWKEAWVKLADLYDKAGNAKLAAEAREKARSLKTS